MCPISKEEARAQATAGMSGVEAQQGGCRHMLVPLTYICTYSAESDLGDIVNWAVLAEDILMPTTASTSLKLRQANIVFC